MAQPEGPHRVIAQRMKALRRKRDWTAQRLAEEMARTGIPWDRSIVANLENGRRATISVEEMLALAFVLDVAPVHLLVPEEDTPYQVAPSVNVDSDTAREWVRGLRALPGTDSRLFQFSRPEHESPDVRTEELTEDQVGRRRRWMGAMGGILPRDEAITIGNADFMRRVARALGEEADDAR